MHEQVGLRAIELGFGGNFRHKDLFDRLQLAEVVATADGAEGRIERCRRKTGFGHRSLDVAPPRPIERTQATGRLVNAKLANGKVELEQGHAAANVGADELRMNAVRQNAAADRAVLPGM